MPEAGIKLQLDAVRRRAEAVKGAHEVPTNCPEEGQLTQPHYLSFLVGLDDDGDENSPPDLNKLARINVFQSGTIGISRVLLGQVRQTFRRNVSDLDVVEKLLRDPPNMTCIDHSLVENNGKRTLQSEIQLADIGLAILQSEGEKLTSHRSDLQALPKATYIEAKEKKSTTPGAKNTLELTQGMEFQFSLPASSMKHVDQCLNDIAKMNKLVKVIATNGKGTVFLYGNGGVAYTPNIPRPMYQKLSQLRNSRMESRPSYVSLGSRDRFFCNFHDGSFILKGPKDLDKDLKQCLQPPRSVAFANTWDSYCIVYFNGEYKYFGRSVPEGLKQQLQDRPEKDDLVCINLGPSGEWFAKAVNGRMWWGGVHQDTDKAIMDLMDDGHVLHTLDFGDDGSYFAGYD
jgi:hypothetical protein